MKYLDEIPTFPTDSARLLESRSTVHETRATSVHKDIEPRKHSSRCVGRSDRSSFRDPRNLDRLFHPFGGNRYSPDHFGGRFRRPFFFQEHPLISVDVFKA